MATNNQAIQLSQELMELQSRYNELLQSRDTALKSARYFRDESFRLDNENVELKKEVAILKESIPSAIAFTPKKKTRKAV